MQSVNQFSAKSMRYNKNQKQNKAIFDFLKNGKQLLGSKKASVGNKDKDVNFEIKLNSKESLKNEHKSSIKNEHKSSIKETHTKASGYVSGYNTNSSTHKQVSKRKDVKTSTNPFKKNQSVHNIRDKAALKSANKFSCKKASLPHAANNYTYGNF